LWSNGRRVFWLGVALLFVLRIFLSTIPLPAWAALIIAPIFIGLPILAIFRGAEGEWGWKTGLLWLLIGVAAHAGGVLLLNGMPRSGYPTVTVDALAQTGLLIWSTGLGALVGLLIKDKNLILPVAIFLAGFDVFLVYTPNTFIAQSVQQNAKVFQSVAMKVPAVKEIPKPGAPPGDRGPTAAPLGFVGPADLIFSMMFFVVLHRFAMRTKETAKWLALVLIGYLALVFLTPLGMLPALVPIGATVLIVNRREFQMNKEEKQGVLLAAVIAVLLAGYGLYQRANYHPAAKPLPPAESQPAPDSQPGSTASPTSVQTS
jgi:hypothetical protein